MKKYLSVISLSFIFIQPAFSSSMEEVNKTLSPKAQALLEKLKTNTSGSGEARNRSSEAPQSQQTRNALNERFNFDLGTVTESEITETFEETESNLDQVD